MILNFKIQTYDVTTLILGNNKAAVLDHFLQYKKSMVQSGLKIPVVL